MKKMIVFDNDEFESLMQKTLDKAIEIYSDEKEEDKNRRFAYTLYQIFDYYSVFEYYKTKPCPTCKGSGEIESGKNDPIACPDCTT